MTALDLTWFQEQVLGGSMLLAIPVAMLAGLVSFFSPCVVPLLPGYLSYATGVSGADLLAGSGARRGRLLAGSALFVLGFTVVFVSFGALFGGLGDLLLAWQRPLTMVLGVLTIVLGLVFLGVLPWFSGEARIHWMPRVGLAAAPLLGFLFGLGWTPCLGPTLAAVQSLAVNEASAVRGAILSAGFSLGLGLPFLLAGLFWPRMLRAVRWVRRHQLWVQRIGGALLIAIGVLLLTGWWDTLVAYLQATPFTVSI